MLLNSTLSCVTTPYGTSPVDAGAALGLPASQPLAQGEETRQQDSPLQIAFDLQRKIFLSLIAEAAALFGVSLLLLLLSLYVAKKSGAATENTFGSRFLHRSSTIFLNISTALALVVAVSITQTGNALEYVSSREAGGLQVTAGRVIQVLQWLAFGFSALFSFITSVRWSRQRRVGLGVQSTPLRQPPKTTAAGFQVHPNALARKPVPAQQIPMRPAIQNAQAPAIFPQMGQMQAIR